MKNKNISGSIVRETSMIAMINLLKRICEHDKK